MRSKDLQSLLNLLKVAEQSGRLHIEVPEDPTAGEPWRAEVQLVQGNVCDCRILRKADGRVLLGGALALSWLKQLADLSWRLEDSTVAPGQNNELLREETDPTIRIPSIISPGEGVGQQGTYGARLPARYAPGNIPRRTALTVQSLAYRSWPREQRQVFALVDGSRTVGTIVSMLPHLSTEQIVSILTVLHSNGLIDE